MSLTHSQCDYLTLPFFLVLADRFGAIGFLGSKSESKLTIYYREAGGGAGAIFANKCGGILLDARSVSSSKSNVS